MREIWVLALVFLTMMVVQAQDAGSWQLADVEDLLPTLETYGEVNSTLALSPDGHKLLWAADDALCLYDLDAEEGKCDPFPENFPSSFSEYNAPRWSLDSAYIAFSEDPFRLMLESDVWVYKVASGEFTNLTDDGVERSWFGDDVDPDLDYALAWSPVGSNLYFFRSEKWSDGWTIDLYQTYPGGYDPQQISSFTYMFPTLSVYFPPAISPDGQTMAVLVLDQTLRDPASGLWKINLENGQAEQVAGVSDLAQVGFPEWQDVRGMIPREVAWADNDTLLVQLFNPQYATGVSWGIQVVDVASGGVTPLVDMSGVADAASLLQAGDDGHTLQYNMVRSAFIPPQADAVIYNHYDGSTPDQPGISMMALPPDGQPIFLGDAPGCDVTSVRGMPRMLQQVAPNGRAVLYNCLLTFEG